MEFDKAMELVDLLGRLAKTVREDKQERLKQF